MNSEQSLIKLLKRAGARKALVVALLIVSFVGFVDATYLASRYYSGIPVGCSILEGCEEVTTSEYATIGNIPIALVGAVFYFSLFILLLAYYERGKRGTLWFILAGTTGAFLSSIALIYIQVAVIEALCLYCLISAGSSTLLFLGSWYLYSLEKKNYLAA